VKPEEKKILVGNCEWFYRESTPNNEGDRLPVLLLHGLPSQSYSWTVVMEELAKEGFRSIAPDWPGSGYSGKPDKRDFAYTPDAFIEALDGFIKGLELDKFHLVVQGFLGSVGLQYALRNPEKIERLAILNAPVSSGAKLPWKMQQLGLPFIGDMLTQDPLFIDRTLEKGTGYTISEDDLGVYRGPYLRSSAAGRSILYAVKRLQLKEAMAEIETGFNGWQQPTLIIWGTADPWLDISGAENLVSICENAQLTKLDKAGHYPQDHWSIEITPELALFLRKKFE